MATSAELLTTGWHWHHAGDLPRAEHAYRQLVQQDPGNAQAWYLLGALAEARGDLAAAATSLEQALRLRPAFAEALHHRGIVCARQGRLAEAAKQFREALCLKPGHVDIQVSLGLALLHQGRYGEAARLLQAALQAQPAHPQAQTHLREAVAQKAYAEGVASLEQGRLEQAAIHLEEALRHRREFPEAYNDLGRVRSRQGNLDDAIACYKQAVGLRPDFAEALTNLSLALRDQKRPLEAEECSRAAIRIRPDLAAAHNALGLALQSQDRLEEAVASYQRAVQLRPGYATAVGNLALACSWRGELDQALTLSQEVAHLRPDAAAHAALGLVHERRGEFDAALASYERALQLDPNCPDAHKGRATVCLLHGDLERGWGEYEWRWKCAAPLAPLVLPQSLPQPPWDGSPLAGRTILLYAEQGLGDTLQFIRYAPLLRERGAHIIVVCQKALVRLLSGCPGMDQVLTEGDLLPAFDVHASLMSLPRLCGTTLATIPANVPYLSADPDLVEMWGRELKTLGGFKIGINWQGSKAFAMDCDRSVPLQEFAPLAAVPGVQLVSLQYGPASEELRSVAREWPITDLGGRLDEMAGPLMDRAAVMKNLDLVVTSCTSIPHLAGGLGVPVCVALGKVACWRWLRDREDSAWYPTMRLFRQERRGEWGPVFQRIVEAVAERMSGERRG
jgi:tetratricopeptide (TPR) repeat protein